MGRELQLNRADTKSKSIFVRVNPEVAALLQEKAGLLRIERKAPVSVSGVIREAINLYLDRPDKPETSTAMTQSDNTDAVLAAMRTTDLDALTMPELRKLADQLDLAERLCQEHRRLDDARRLAREAERVRAAITDQQYAARRRARIQRKWNKRHEQTETR
jgi:hypothetical protein